MLTYTFSEGKVWITEGLQTLDTGRKSPPWSGKVLILVRSTPHPDAQSPLSDTAPPLSGVANDEKEN